MLWPWQDNVHITFKMAHLKMNDNLTMNYGSKNDKNNPTYGKYGKRLFVTDAVFLRRDYRKVQK